MNILYLLWEDEMLFQFPFLKLMVRVCWYPLFFCFFCVNPRRRRQVPGYLSEPQGQMQTNLKKGPNEAHEGHKLHEIRVQGGEGKRRDFSWGPLYPVTILVIRVPHISLTEDWRSEFGYCRMFASSQGVEERSGSNYIQFRGMWGILMISITPVVTLGGGAH